MLVHLDTVLFKSGGEVIGKVRVSVHGHRKKQLVWPTVE